MIGTWDDGSDTAALGFHVVMSTSETGIGPNILFEVSTSLEVTGQFTMQLFSKLEDV